MRLDGINQGAGGDKVVECEGCRMKDGILVDLETLEIAAASWYAHILLSSDHNHVINSADGLCFSFEIRPYDGFFTLHSQFCPSQEVRLGIGPTKLKTPAFFRLSLKFHATFIEIGNEA